MLTNGAIFQGKYRIQRPLGAGSFGAVYLVSHERVPESELALKVIRPPPAGFAEYRRRFLQEVRIGCRLRSPHIVPVRDFDATEDGLLYFTMDRVPGVPLDVVIGRSGPLPWRRSVEIARQILDALEEAHREGVIHRDVKPGNVLVEQRPDGTDWVRVLDFGIARVAGADAVTREWMGTPHYMAPEQAQTPQEIDGRADIYAVGVVLYEMLTGVRPFRAPDPLEILLMHRSVDAVPPTELRPDLGIPRAIEAIVMQALEKRPEERYGSAATMMDAIDAVVTVLSRESLGRAALAAAQAPEAVEEEASLPTRLGAVTTPLPLSARSAEPPTRTVPPPSASAPPGATIASSGPMAGPDLLGSARSAAPAAPAAGPSSKSKVPGVPRVPGTPEVALPGLIPDTMGGFELAPFRSGPGSSRPIIPQHVAPPTPAPTPAEEPRPGGELTAARARAARLVVGGRTDILHASTRLRIGRSAPKLPCELDLAAVTPSGGASDLDWSIGTGAAGTPGQRLCELLLYGGSVCLRDMSAHGSFVDGTRAPKGSLVYLPSRFLLELSGTGISLVGRIFPRAPGDEAPGSVRLEMTGGGDRAWVWLLDEAPIGPEDGPLPLFDDEELGASLRAEEGAIEYDVDGRWVPLLEGDTVSIAGAKLTAAPG